MDNETIVILSRRQHVLKYYLRLNAPINADYSLGIEIFTRVIVLGDVTVDGYWISYCLKLYFTIDLQFEKRAGSVRENQITTCIHIIIIFIGVIRNLSRVTNPKPRATGRHDNNKWISIDATPEWHWIL